MKTNFKRILIILLLLLFLFLYLMNSVFMIHHFIDYSVLFLTRYLPVSFPFLIVSSLLLQYGILEYVPLKAYYIVFFLSVISGFPNGAKAVHDLVKNGTISHKVGNQMLLFSHFPNPLFVFGTVYLSLQNYQLTLILFLSVFFSNFFLLLFLKKEKEIKIPFIKTSNSFSKNLYEAILSASHTILLVYGISLFFYFILSLITRYFFVNSYLYVFLCGVFDLTKGVLATTILSDVVHRAYFILFFISFGGISIHMQIKSILEDTSLSYAMFLLGRVVSTVVAFLIFHLLLS